MYLIRRVSTCVDFIHKLWSFITTCWCFSKLGIFHIIVSFEKKLEDTFYTNSFSFGKVVRDSPADILKTGIWIFSWVIKKYSGQKQKEQQTRKKNKKSSLWPLLPFCSFLQQSNHFFSFFLDNKMPALRAIFIDLKMDIFFCPVFLLPF